jgi:hypothetical protein
MKSKGESTAVVVFLGFATTVMVWVLTFVATRSPV